MRSKWWGGERERRGQKRIKMKNDLVQKKKWGLIVSIDSIIFVACILYIFGQLVYFYIIYV